MGVRHVLTLLIGGMTTSSGNHRAWGMEHGAQGTGPEHREVELGNSVPRLQRRGRGEKGTRRRPMFLS